MKLSDRRLDYLREIIDPEEYMDSDEARSMLQELKEARRDFSLIAFHVLADSVPSHGTRIIKRILDGHKCCDLHEIKEAANEVER